MPSDNGMPFYFTNQSASAAKPEDTLWQALYGRQFFLDPTSNVTWPMNKDRQSVLEEMAKQTMAAQRNDTVTAGLRINPANWERFLANTPPSRNIEDLRRQPMPRLTMEDFESPPIPANPPLDLEMARRLGYGNIGRSVR